MIMIGRSEVNWRGINKRYNLDNALRLAQNNLMLSQWSATQENPTKSDDDGWCEDVDHNDDGNGYDHNDDADNDGDDDGNDEVDDRT